MILFTLLVYFDDFHDFHSNPKNNSFKFPNVVKSFDSWQSISALFFEGSNVTFQAINIVVDALSLFELISDHCVGTGYLLDSYEWRFRDTNYEWIA